MGKKMKIKNYEIKKLFQLKIYLKGSMFCKYKNPILMDEDEIDQFYSELNDSTPIMEFGGFYFPKSEFRYAKTKVKKIKVEK